MFFFTRRLSAFPSPLEHSGYYPAVFPFARPNSLESISVLYFWPKPPGRGCLISKPRLWVQIGAHTEEVAPLAGSGPRSQDTRRPAPRCDREGPPALHVPGHLRSPVACPRLPRKGQRRPTPPRRLLREQAAAPSRAATAPGRRSAGNQTERVTRVGGDRGGGTGAAAEGGASESLRFLLDLTAVSLGLLSVPTFSALAVS